MMVKTIMIMTMMMTAVAAANGVSQR